MGLIGKFINTVLGKNKDLNISTNKLLELFTPYFSGQSNPDLSSTFVAAVNTHAMHISKAKPVVYLKDQEAQSKKNLSRLLQLKPNPVMTAPVLWRTLGYSYYMNNLAIAFIEWDYNNIKEPVKAIWPLDFDKNSLDCRVSDSGKLYVSFTLDGIQRIADTNDLIMLSREADPSTLPFGRRSKAVDTVLKVLQTSYEGAEQAIRTSAFIRFLVQSTTPLTDKQKEERAKYFAETYLGKDASGVVYLDQAQQVIKVDSQAKYANAAEMKEFKNDIYSYLNSNEKIVKAEYSEQEWQSYYETSIETFFILLEAELTSKLFTVDEINRGNRIVIEANRLHSATLTTRKAIAEAYMKLPVYKPNVVCDLLYIPKLENGDKEYATLNYVQADKQNEYQDVGNDPAADPKNEPKEEKTEEEEEDATSNKSKNG